MRGLVVLLIASACSFSGVDTSTKIPTTYKLRCSPLPPIADTIFAIGGGTLFMVSATSEPTSIGAGIAKLAGTVFGLTLLFGNGAGAIYGFSAQARCARLRDSPPRDYAEAFGNRALEVAQAGDCARAMLIGAKAGEYDRAYYTHTFLVHPVIVRCVADGNERYRTANAARIRQDEAAVRRSEAQVLLEQAREAARAGDCVLVASLGSRIQALDSHTYDAWFVKDPEIAACLPK